MKSNTSVDWLTNLGRFFFAIAMVFFGIQHFIYAIPVAGPVAGPPWILGRPLWTYFVGAFFLAASVSIATKFKAGSAATLLGTMLFLYVLILYVPGLLAHPHDPGSWTSVSELLAMSGAAFVLAGSLTVAPPPFRRWHNAADKLIPLGRLLFAIPLVVFGLQHFMFARFVATLVPSWIPRRLFWAYFVGGAFIAASVSIASKVKGPLAATLLGTMFFLWVIFLHAPRVAAAPHNGKEWTSAFVALAMCGGALIVARTLPGGPADRQAYL